MNYGIDDEEYMEQYSTEDKVTKITPIPEILGVSEEDALEYGCYTEYKVHEEPRYIKLLKSVDSALGLDLSVNSTGVSIWDGKELTHAVIDVNVEGFSEFEKRQALKEALTEIVGGMNFDLVVVEDVFGGINFTTVRDLLGLNDVPDELINEGVIGCKRFFRESNVSWKKDLRVHAKISGCPNDKEEIRQILEYLEFDTEIAIGYNTSDKKDRYQDVLDSLGLIIGVITREVLGMSQEKVKYTLKSMNIWHCSSIDEYEACYNEDDNFEVIHVGKKVKADLIKNITRTEASVTLLCEVNVDYLGRLAIDYDIPLELETVCLVLTPKSKRKPRKKKSKVRIIK